MIGITKKNNIRKYVLLGIIILLASFLLYALRDYYVAVLSSIVLFTLFNPIYKYLHKRVFKNKTISVTLVLLMILIVVIAPIFFLSIILVNEIRNISHIFTFANLQNIVTNTFGQDISSRIFENVSTNVFGYINSYFTSIISSFFNFFISLFIIFFLLYFLFTKSEEINKTLIKYLPFKKSNIKQLIDESKKMTKSTVISSGLIAVLQGFLLGLGFYIFGIEGIFFWGFIGAILSFFPAIGTPLIYLPASIILLFQHDYFSGIGILLWGIILISSSDNVLRPIIRNRISSTHPLITLFGIIIGLTYFGIVGIIIGPLLISYLLIMIKIYKEEHL